MRKYLFLVLVILTACVTVRKIRILPIEAEADPDPPIVVESPLKAHLVDGSTVMVPKGVGSLDRKHIVLEMRNKAPETHYISHVALIEVAHSASERVYPAQNGRRSP